ncbi:MAG: WD40/YVTN/BNR-like repeat-containing protein [Solirubrobacteraceae bacterium]
MADYLGTVERRLAQLTERGVDRTTSGPTPVRRQRRRELLIVVPVLLVALLVVAGVLAFGSGANRRAATPSATQPSATQPSRTTPHKRTRHRHSTQSHTTSSPSLSSHAPVSATAARHVQAPAGPVPPGFGAESFTAINPNVWWLLGSAPCSSPPCTSVLRTDDAGRSFVGTPAPRTTQVSQLRFANAADGFAFGRQLWVTHDAGAHWHQVRLGGTVTEVAAANGFAYALVRYGHRGFGRLERSPLGADTWTTLTQAGSAFAGLWAHHQNVLVGTSGAKILAVSHDAGVTFTREAAPSGLPCHYEEPSSKIVWAHCATGTESATWRSQDFGAHFLPTSRLSLPNFARFAAASADTAVVGATTLFRTTDAGAHYTAIDVPAVTAWQYLGFTDPSHGVAVGYLGMPIAGNERLYVTSDGGATYRLVSTR